MRTYHYTLSEYDPKRLWVIVAPIKHLEVSLEDHQGFYEWATKEWPGPRYKVELDPWELSPEFSRTQL